MAKERKAHFYGGPKDGEIMDFWDKDQLLGVFANHAGETAIYVREEERPGDTFVRFKFGDILDREGKSAIRDVQGPLRPQRPEEIQNSDEEPEVLRQRVHVTLNEKSHEWELVVDGEVLEAVPEKKIRTAQDAADWLRELGLGA